MQFCESHSKGKAERQKCIAKRRVFVFATCKFAKRAERIWKDCHCPPPHKTKAWKGHKEWEIQSRHHGTERTQRRCTKCSTVPDFPMKRIERVWKWCGYPIHIVQHIEQHNVFFMVREPKPMGFLRSDLKSNDRLDDNSNTPHWLHITQMESSMSLSQMVSWGLGPSMSTWSKTGLGWTLYYRRDGLGFNHFPKGCCCTHVHILITLPAISYGQLSSVFYLQTTQTM